MKTRLLSATLALLLFSGCATDESGRFLNVDNDTNVPLAVFAFPNGSLIDLMPHLPPGSFDDNLVMPGHRLGFDSVPGYQPGHGVFLAVYVVQSTGADLTLTLPVSDAQLKFSRGEVNINALPSPRVTQQ